MEKATRMASARTSQGESVISGSRAGTAAKGAMGWMGWEYEPRRSREGNQNAGAVSSLTLPWGLCCLKFGQQFRKAVDDPDAEAFQAFAVLVAVGG